MSGEHWVFLALSVAFLAAIAHRYRELRRLADSLREHLRATDPTNNERGESDG